MAAILRREPARVKSPGRIFDSVPPVTYGSGMASDVIVIGAGVAGLSCAARLQAAGAGVLLLDRADKPGGRCATRQFHGQSADYGPVFLHGRDPDFLAAVRTACAETRPGWPGKVSGTGKPCQPEAFSLGESRLGIPEGVNAFPRSLAAGLRIQLNCRVQTVSWDGGLFSVTDGAGGQWQSRDLVLALALEQALPFLRQLAPGEGIPQALALLGMFHTVPCLTVIAGYPAGTRMPEWDVQYPEAEESLLLVSNESGKRDAKVLVVQAAPRWSRVHLEDDPDAWSDALLASAARVTGAWVTAPEWRHTHRWRFARLDRANELAAPLVLSRNQGRLGVCGDLFSPGGGVQAAWRSGRELAERLGAPHR